MATLNAEHINPFLMAAKKVFQDMCFVQVQIQKPGLKEANFGKGTWVIIIGVTGEMKGQVLLAMSEEDACNIASKMCMMEVKEIDDFAASALSEMRLPYFLPMELESILHHRLYYMVKAVLQIHIQEIFVYHLHLTQQRLNCIWH